MIRLSCLFAALSLSLVAAPSASAFPPIPKAPKVPKVPKGPDLAKDAANDAKDHDRKQLSQINSQAQWGMRKIPSDFVGDFEKRSAKMEEARVPYDDCKARLATVKNTALDEGAMRYWGEFKREFEQGELQLPAAKAFEPITTLHAQRIPVQDADLDALDAAVAIFEKGHDKESASALKKWKKTAAETRATNVKLLKSAVAKAASSAASLDLSARNATLEKAEAALTAMAEAMKADTAPIDAAIWASFEEALTAADAYSPKIRTSFTDAAWTFRLYDAWYAPEVAPAVAKAFGNGDVHASGLLNKKEGRITFEAEAGSCYALSGRFMNRTGNESVGDVDRVWDKDFADVVPFSGGGSGFSDFRGACPTKAMRISFDIKLKTAGSKVAYQWIVVSWKRETFPVDIAARSTAWGPEPCSAPMAENVFKNAVPGMLVWSDKGAPYLIHSLNQGNFVVRSLKGHDSQIKISSSTSTWPEKKSLNDTTFRENCHDYKDSMDPLVNTMIKCHQGVTKQYGPKFEAAYRRRDSARTIAARASSVNAIDRLVEADAALRKSKCGPTEVKVEKAMSAMLERMNDWFLENNAPKDGLDVAGYLRDVEEGRRRFSK